MTRPEVHRLEKSLSVDPPTDAVDGAPRIPEQRREAALPVTVDRSTRIPSARVVLSAAVALVMLIAVIVAVSRTGGVDSGSGAPGAAASTGSPSPTTAPSSEQAFVADVLDTPGLTTSMPSAELVEVGQGICKVVAYQQYTRAELVAAVGTTKFGPAVSSVMVDAAQRNLCPQYAWPSVSTGRGAETSAAPSGPVARVAAGTYEVGSGSGQVAPGKYRSTGPDGSGGAGCYYARLRDNDGGVGDIIGNDLTQGPSIMNVRAGDGYVQVSGCTFIKM